MGKNFKLKMDQFREDVRKKIFYNECGKTLEHIAQRGGRFQGGVG